LIVEKGFVPLIAHPERTQYFFEKLSSRNADKLKNFGQNDIGVAQNASRSFLKRFWPFASLVPRPASRPTEATSSELLSSSEVCLYHANLGSFTGFYGPNVQRNAYELLKLGAYTALASDLHESRSAADVLVQGKFENNPFLKKLAEFDGSTNMPQTLLGGGSEGQGELF